MFCFVRVVHREHAHRGKNSGWKRESDGESDKEGGEEDTGLDIRLEASRSNWSGFISRVVL